MSDTTSGELISSHSDLVVSQQGLEREVLIDDIILPPNPRRPIDSDKVTALAGSMAEIGLNTPIIVTRDNILVTGNHRLAAARQLGWKTIRARIVPPDILLNELIAIDENLQRKELSVLEQSEHISRREEIMFELHKRALSGENQFTSTSGAYVISGTTGSRGLYYRPPLFATGKVTTEELAAFSGLAKSTYQERKKIARDIPEDLRNLIRPNRIADNKSELLRLVKMSDAKDQRKVVEKVLTGEVKTIKEAESIVRRDTQRAEFAVIANDMKDLADIVKLICGDIFDIEDQFDDNSIDCIITDPPYVLDWAENIAPFMIIANRILKPGGALIMYLGHARLREFFDGLRECELEFGENALQYYHECALEHTGHLAAMHHVGAMNGFKPILIAMKPPTHQPFGMYNDLIKGSGREKDAHEWQQSSEEILPLVDAFTRPGDTILDPLCGSGSTGAAVLIHARKFVGIDIDGENVKVALGRLSNVIVERDYSNKREETSPG
jgi:site-specific DNA-methyltransferase (adenine-specific)